MLHKICGVLLAVALSMPTFAQDKPTPTFSVPPKGNITYKVVPGADGTYGYDILIDGKTKIHQPSRPAMPGNKGFSKKSSAEKVAELAIKKIHKGEMPPTITPEELKKLHAI